MKRPPSFEQMPYEINGVTYYSAVDVAKQVGISRTTLWRWRQEGKIPLGQRYRGHQILFNAAELDAIREYANRLEPADTAAVKQLRLFNGLKPKEE